MYIMLTLNVVMLVLFILGIYFSFKRKWKNVIIFVSIIFSYILFNVIIFNTTFGKNIFRIHPLFWRAQEKAITFTINPISVDGDLNEPVWKLEKHQFIIDEGWRINSSQKLTDDTPFFNFLYDSSNIYLGVKYIIGEHKKNIIFHSDSLYITLHLEACIGNIDKEFRLSFSPFNDKKEPIGKSFCDCNKCRVVTNFKFASKYENGIWEFELSVPHTEVMDENDINLFYRLTFGNYYTQNPLVSYYPEEMAYKVQYKEYFRITNKSKI